MLMIITTDFYLKIFGHIVRLNRWYCVGSRPWVSAYNSINIVEASNKILQNHKRHSGLEATAHFLGFFWLTSYFKKIIWIKRLWIFPHNGLELDEMKLLLMCIDSDLFKVFAPLPATILLKVPIPTGVFNFSCHMAAYNCTKWYCDIKLGLRYGHWLDGGNNH